MPAEHLPIPPRQLAVFPWAFAAALFLALTFVFAHRTASTAWAFPRFAIVSLVVLYLPGRVLTGWVGG